MSTFCIRVPSASLAKHFGCEVTRVTQAAGIYDRDHLPPCAFGWITVGNGLRGATYIEVDTAERILIHPKADAWRLRRVIEDLTARELAACIMGRRGPRFTNPSAIARVPMALEAGYFESNSGKKVPLTDFVAPVVLSYSYRREDLDTSEHWAGGVRIG